MQSVFDFISTTEAMASGHSSVGSGAGQSMVLHQADQRPPPPTKFENSEPKMDSSQTDFGDTWFAFLRLTSLQHQAGWRCPLALFAIVATFVATIGGVWAGTDTVGPLGTMHGNKKNSMMQPIIAPPDLSMGLPHADPPPDLSVGLPHADPGSSPPHYFPDLSVGLPHAGPESKVDGYSSNSVDHSSTAIFSDSPGTSTTSPAKFSKTKTDKNYPGFRPRGIDVKGEPKVSKSNATVILGPSLDDPNWPQPGRPHSQRFAQRNLGTERGDSPKQSASYHIRPVVRKELREGQRERPESQDRKTHRALEPRWGRRRSDPIRLTVLRMSYGAKPVRHPTGNAAQAETRLRIDFDANETILARSGELPEDASEPKWSRNVSKIINKSINSNPTDVKTASPAPAPVFRLSVVNEGVPLVLRRRRYQNRRQDQVSTPE